MERTMRCKPLLLAMATATTVLLLMQPFNMAMAQQPMSNVLIACGIAGKTYDDANREWIGDKNFFADAPGSNLQINLSGTNNTTPTYVKTGSEYTIPNYAPFTASRILDGEVTYTIKHINPGRYFLRLYFVDSGASFTLDDVVFSVILDDNIVLMEGATFTDLIKNPQDPNAYGSVTGYRVKEFIINVDRPSIALTVVPRPYKYGAISGIEFQRIPARVFPNHAKDVRTMENMALPSDTNYTYETVYRYNVGGQEVTDALGRKWSADDALHLSANNYNQVDQDNDVSLISYGDLNPLAAPVQVYMSGRVLIYDSDDDNVNRKLSWSFPVNAVNPYVVRLHFCELKYDKPNERVFHLTVNEKEMQQDFDVVKEAGGRNVAMVKDFHVDRTRMGKNDKISLDLVPNGTGLSTHANCILNGIEIFMGRRAPSDPRRRRSNQLN